MQTYHFKSQIENIKDVEIFTANSGKGYVQNGELHITENNYHFVYKFDSKVKGWYMHNANTDEDVYLDEGACPTAEYETIDVKSLSDWGVIWQPDSPNVVGMGIANDIE